MTDTETVARLATDNSPLEMTLLSATATSVRTCLRGILAATAGISLAACGDGPTPPEVNGAGIPTNLEIRPATVLLEAINDSTVLTFLVKDAQGLSIPGLTPTWSVDSARIATVLDGVVVARAAGTARIGVSVEAGGTTLRTTIPVVVAPRPLSWTLGAAADTIGLGGRLAVRMLGYDARGSLTGEEPSVAWSTSDTNVVAVDLSGLLHGRALGHVTVTGSTAEGSASARVLVVPAGGVRVSAGALNSCAIDRTGAAYCWGFNDQGQLGTHTSPDRCSAGPISGSFACSLSPLKVEGGLSLSVITNGFEHTCALDTAGRAYCWGANDRGQLGTDQAADACVAAVFGTRGPCSYTPLPVATSLRFTAIGAGYRTTCGLTTDERIFCWGNNEQGSIGILPIALSIPVPTEVAGGLRYRSLTVGWLHACAVATDGITRCWGFNGSGQLGDGSWQPQFAPTPVAGSHSFSVLSAGKEHTCAFAISEGPYCWGAAVGIVPSGKFGPNWESAPLTTVDRTPVDTLVSGAQFSCGLYGGWVRCWGADPIPDGSGASLTPDDLALGATFEQIAAGFSHVCGVRTGGAVYCWGSGVEGELGDGEPHEYGTPESSSLPVRVSLPAP